MLYLPFPMSLDFELRFLSCRSCLSYNWNYSSALLAGFIATILGIFWQSSWYSLDQSWSFIHLITWALQGLQFVMFLMVLYMLVLEDLDFLGWVVEGPYCGFSYIICHFFLPFYFLCFFIFLFFKIHFYIPMFMLQYHNSHNINESFIAFILI